MGWSDGESAPDGYPRDGYAAGNQPPNQPPGGGGGGGGGGRAAGQDSDGRGYDFGGAYDVRPDGDLERRLTELLVRFPNMQEPGGRQAVVRALARLGTDILASAPRSSRTLEDVHGMVETAADHPGGLYLLLKVVGRDYEGTKAWRDADRFLREHYPEPLLHPQERDRLFELLRALTRSNIEDLLRFAAEHDEGFADRLAVRRARFLRAETELRALVAVLEDAPVVPDRAHPLTAFVESAAAPEDTDLRQKLQFWNGSVSMRQNWPVDLMREARSRAAMEVGRAPEESCLLIEVQSRAPAPEAYDVDAWLCTAGREPSRLRAALRAHGQAQLDECINAVHDQASEILAGLAPGMRVEFLLPWHLMWLPVDQAVVRPHGAIGRTLGSHRSVVVRSAERQRLPEWHAALQKRWNWLKNHGSDDHEGAVVWVGPKQRVEPLDLFYELNRTAEVPVVYVLLQPPRHTWDAAADYLPVLMETGIPVVLAVRPGATESEVRPRLESYLRGALKDLPERVWALRKERSGASHDHGPATLDLPRHVSLVWDSPEALKRTKAALRQPKVGVGA